MIDRPIRPLFPDDFLNEVQIMLFVLSADKVNNPDILGIIGASAALSISDIPFQGPIAGGLFGAGEKGDAASVDRAVEGAARTVALPSPPGSLRARVFHVEHLL